MEILILLGSLALLIALTVLVKKSFGKLWTNPIDSNGKKMKAPGGLRLIVTIMALSFFHLSLFLLAVSSTEPDAKTYRIELFLTSLLILFGVNTLILVVRNTKLGIGLLIMYFTQLVLRNLILILFPDPEISNMLGGFFYIIVLIQGISLIYLITSESIKTYFKIDQKFIYKYLILGLAIGAIFEIIYTYS